LIYPDIREYSSQYHLYVNQQNENKATDGKLEKLMHILSILA